LFTVYMGCLINAVKSSYALLNYGAHKSVRYIGWQKARKMYTKSVIGTNLF
jgi:hypothetical protein